MIKLGMHDRHWNWDRRSRATAMTKKWSNSKRHMIDTEIGSKNIKTVQKLHNNKKGSNSGCMIDTEIWMIDDLERWPWQRNDQIQDTWSTLKLGQTIRPEHWPCQKRKTPTQHISFFFCTYNFLNTKSTSIK